MEKQIKANFEKLRRFLDEEEETRIDELREEEREKQDWITAKMDELSSSLSTRIHKIKEDMEGTKTQFLQVSIL